MKDDPFTITGDELVAFYSSAMAALVASLDAAKVIDGETFASALALGSGPIDLRVAI